MAAQTRRTLLILLASTIVTVGGTALLAALLVRGAAPPVSVRLDALPTWSSSSTPTLSGRNDLRSVTCTWQASCFAVGSSASTGLPTAMIESWNGSEWSVTQSQSRGVDSWLNSVACPTSAWCVAVGGDSPTGDSDNPLDQTLVEVLTGGRWSVIPSPTPGNGDQNDLQSVACTSPAFCMAAGSYSPVSNPYDPEVKPLLERWDGSTWTVTPAGTASLGRQSVLRSVSCTSRSSCLAVGSTSSITLTGDSAGSTLVEHWDGAAWRMVATPRGGLGRTASLESVSCLSPSACMAVGSFTVNGGAHAAAERTLAEWWNGSTWTVVTSQNHGVAASSLRSVSCT
jgi:hypothetical protein